MLGYTPLQEQTPQEQTPPKSRHPPKTDTPRADTPQNRHPPRADPHKSRHPPEQTPPRADTPEQTPPKSRHPPKNRHPPKTRPPKEQTPPHTVNERPVCIILECILVILDRSTSLAVKGLPKKTFYGYLCVFLDDTKCDCIGKLKPHKCTETERIHSRRLNTIFITSVTRDFHCDSFKIER